MVGTTADGPTYKKMFGEPAPEFDTIFSVACSVNFCATCNGDKVGSAFNNNAAAPATCGQAIDVPLIVAVAVSEEIPTDFTDDPGAKTSTQEP